MQKMKKCRKGFTLTELAIVIAVIAILIAVLVPTFISLINKAEESTDKQLVKNLNTTLSTYETTNGETDGIIEVITVLREEGYDITKLTPTSDNADIVYNSTTHSFVLYTDDFKNIALGSASSTDNLIVIGCSTSSTQAAYENLRITEFCVYGVNGTSFECGYENSKIEITLYTESGTTTINAPYAEINHYGSAGTVNITAVADASYHLYAQVDTVKIAKGHVVVENGASITKLVVNTTTEEAVTTTLKDEGSIGRVVSADSSFTVKDSNGDVVTTISTVTVTSVDKIDKMDTETYITSVPETITSGTYVLNSNITGNFVIPEGEVVTINLNGWTITGGEGTDNNVAIYNNGTLTITGSGNVVANGTGTDAAVYCEYGANTYIDGGTYTQGNWYLLNNYGYMEINDAIIIGSSSSSSVVHNGYYTTPDNASELSNAVMVINGISFGNESASDFTSTSSLIKNDNLGVLTINDGKFKESPAWIVLNWNICTINGGEFSGDCVIYVGAVSGSEYCVGEITINGGSFECTTTMLRAEYGATVTINNGTFESTVSGYYSTAIYDSTLIINGGSFEMAGAFIYASNATITITDGTFESVQTLIYVASGVSVNISNGTFTHSSSSYWTLYLGGDNSSIVITGGTITYNNYLAGKSSSVSTYTYKNDATLINLAE